MTVFYDDIDVNRDILLDLPFREGIGAITQDVAKPHHPVTLINAPTWTPLVSELMTLNFDGATQYLECPAADCADLDFTTENYSIWGWFNWTINDQDQILIGRYEVDVGGWELYLTRWGGLDYLSLRHHHAGGATLRTGAYSIGWTPGVDWFFGAVRFGTFAGFLRNGVQVASVSDTLIDPEPCAQDLVIGTRFTKDDHFFDGMMWRPRVAAGNVLGGLIMPDEFDQVYDREGVWF